MKWEDYYEKIEEWKIRTSKNRMSTLEDIGPADEVTDAICILGYDDESVATNLLDKAVNMGVHFTGEQLGEISDLCEVTSLKKAFDVSAPYFSAKDLEDMCCLIDDDWIVDIAKKRNLTAPEYLREEVELSCDEPITELLEDTIQSAYTALDSLLQLEPFLENAENISVADMLMNSFWPSLLKNQALHEVQAQARFTGEKISELNNNLKTLKKSDKNLNFRYAKLASAADLWLDSTVVDCFVHLQIGKMKKNIQHAIRQAEQIINELEDILYRE